MGFAKERVKFKIQHLCFLSAKTIFYLLKKCKLANKKWFCYVGAKLKVPSFYSAPSQSPKPLCDILGRPC